MRWASRSSTSSGVESVARPSRPTRTSLPLSVQPWSPRNVSEQSGHIAAVGFEMYLRLLEEAVAVAEGNPVEEQAAAPVIVELALDAYLPVDYVQDEVERVDLYRRASGVYTLVELDDLAEELAERFGELPEPALNLIGLSRIKILARQVGVTAVNYRSGALSLTGVTASEAAPALIYEATGGVVGGREGRITVRGSTLAPLELAEKSLRTLTQSAFSYQLPARLRGPRG